MFGSLDLTGLAILVASGAVGLQGEKGKFKGKLRLEVLVPPTPQLSGKEIV